MSFELAEKSILGTMLKENYLILDSGIQETFFSTHIHKNIFTSMCELSRKSKPVDYITLMTMKEPAELGGANYLADLNNFSNPARFDEYREIMIENWKEKEKANLLQQAQSENWSIGEIQKAFDNLEAENTPQEDASIKNDLVKIFELPFHPQEISKGTTTGLTDLDKLLDGFQDGEMTIIGARPSMGKTDTLNHLALHAGWRGHLPIIFSLEMNRGSMINRMIAVTGGYNRLRMRDPYRHFDETQKNNWSRSIGYLGKADIQIDDRSGLTVAQIKARARQIIKANPDKRPVIYIDYLQLIRPDNPREDQTQRIGQISYDLKGMAKEFGCPVVVLSQLSRSVEKRDDKRPIMSDLRDSGNIEQDADVIAFLYRDDYYYKDSENRDVLEIIIAKHRNGPTGTAMAAYIKDTGKLYNIDWTKQGTG
ncbi:DnaB-like helicase C-terminal domain-containing protein [Sporosarcina saromensis]|uniref:DNA 5'-3' helicase n=1 Tax=Sporosarcina saromensis TaxID=359365 RepID=A0ABU4G5I3_9BACL|nr:DnaB-like helicase C-terminal domain-containing protein [Sporosarcina saromensis]MDW0112235.1 DnaB-like helicase C-terminal domain-containing protein [Sporosarcina saromensis]